MSFSFSAMLESLLPVSLTHYVLLSSTLFVIGMLGLFLNRRHVIVILMAVELLFLAASMNFIAFSSASGDLTGQVFALFILATAAAEVTIGLAILVVYYRNRASIAIDDISDLKG